MRIDRFGESEGFKARYRKLPPDIKALVGPALKLLMENPGAKKLRLHPLNGYDPKLWKIDLLPNHSWQLAFHLEGTKAVLCFVGTHKDADRL